MTTELRFTNNYRGDRSGIGWGVEFRTREKPRCSMTKKLVEEGGDGQVVERATRSGRGSRGVRVVSAVRAKYDEAVVVVVAVCFQSVCQWQRETGRRNQDNLGFSSHPPAPASIIDVFTKSDAIKYDFPTVTRFVFNFASFLFRFFLSLLLLP